MTEPELIEVLHKRFNVDEGRLNQLAGRPDLFAKSLFGELLERRKAHPVLIDIFNHYIEEGKELCETEKAIVREVKSWPEKPVHLHHLTCCFMDSELIRFDPAI